uniref:Uncharacterized protein n=1 Tax=Rhizophora mucronata TaxID=61149 RepID=A0A2P2MY84_RHIMU
MSIIATVILSLAQANLENFTQQFIEEKTPELF